MFTILSNFSPVRLHIFGNLKLSSSEGEVISEDEGEIKEDDKKTSDYEEGEMRDHTDGWFKADACQNSFLRKFFQFQNFLLTNLVPVDFLKSELAPGVKGVDFSILVSMTKVVLQLVKIFYQ